MKRRELLKKSFLGGALVLAVPQLSNAKGFCEYHVTPAQPEGPFYPIVDQVDTDADLIRVEGSSQIAKGQIVIIEGTVRNQYCLPVANALVEIWQACHTGKYDHPADPNTAEKDPHFQYWGKAVTSETGFYRFRTIIPGAYPAGQGWIRPPHVHYKVSALGYKEMITQMYFSGNHLNQKDRILQSLSQTEQSKVIVEFKNKEGLAHPVGEFSLILERMS